LKTILQKSFSQVSNNILSVIGKGNKERKIFLTPAAKKSINSCLMAQIALKVDSQPLFIFQGTIIES
jgi:integrase/recombinase XerD